MAATHPDIVLGFEDEVWWSREAQPQMHAWSDDKPVRLVEKTVPAKDPAGKAVACYGLYVPTINQMVLRFVQGRPISVVTCAFLAWLALYFTAQGKRALGLIWDNACLARQPGGASVDQYPQSPRQTRGRLSLARLSVTPVRVPGSIRSNPSGCMGNGPSWNPLVCSLRRSSSSGSVHYYQCELTDPLAQPDCKNCISAVITATGGANSPSIDMPMLMDISQIGKKGSSYSHGET